MQFKNKKIPVVATGLSIAMLAALSYAAQSGKLQFGTERQSEAKHSARIDGASTWSMLSASRRPESMTQQQLRRGKAPSMEEMVFSEPRYRKPMNASQMMPLQPKVAREFTDYNMSRSRADMLKRPSTKASMKAGMTTAQAVAAAVCDESAFASSTGSALVNLVKSSTSDCINSLFSVAGQNQYYIFNESQMVTIANALYSSAASYNGTNSGSVLQMVMFLRAGYYVQYYNPSVVGTYGASLKNSVRTALDSFFNSSYFGLVNDTHGEILSEAVILIDSSGENARYINVVKRLLAGYNSSYDAYWYMKNAVNNTFTVMFRGHYNADFQTLVQSDSSIIDSLYNFANANFSRLGTAEDYMFVNAGGELARFLQYTGATKSVASSRTKALGDRSSITGVTAPMWVRLGSQVDYYDKANCAYYGMCNFKARVEAAALPISHTCSSTLKLRAQSMSASELSWACSRVAGQESYFHTKMGTSGRPVANDNNTALEMVVFNSSTDYGTYAGAIFDIDTNNGGMYLEGDPSVVGNQARFIAYEAEWVLPTFDIWNLTHEYVHYLDGRYNLYGDFGTSISQKTIWWIEGFAEYMSYSYTNVEYTSAKSEAAKGTYALSTIFQNDYGSGQTRVYNWGYLAVRYMFEKRNAQVSSILGYLRPGNYTGYQTYMNGIGSQNDADFRTFLTCVATPTNPGCGGGTGNQLPVAGFNVAVSNLTATFTDTSTDADGSISSRSWSFGDGTTSTAANPSKTYSAAGTYTVTLTVTDNSGGTNTTTRTVTVTSATNQLPVANFSVSTSNLTASFTDTSTDADGTIASRSWNFGDNTTSTVVNPSKTYAAAGTYTVTLTVTDNRGGTTTTSRSVTVSSAANQLPVANFSVAVSGLSATFTDTSTDADGSIASRSWNFGDNTTSTVANPSKTYAAAGTYTVTLTVTDNRGGKTTTSRSVTVTSGGTTLPECSTSRLDELGKNCSRSNISAATGNYAYYFIYIPTGTTQLKITTSGGTGNANLYYSRTTWATTSTHHQRSTNTGNSESITVTNPTVGYNYISVHAASGFSGVKLSTQY